ncbi:MAG: carbohydrate hydrolase [Spirochaetae bacterium HGW-Spirochaetae-9]|nr:MAG: carbohydrate hydrolase [Spirochaetae bacterium HGW-Spirochaetae-9]
MTFFGYRRPDGKVGIRNHVLILPASVCASDTARIIASQVSGAISFTNQNGCAQIGKDLEYTMDILAGFAANPNVYGTVVVSLGCETCQANIVGDAIRKLTNKPLRTVIIQQEGGTLKAVEKGVRNAKQLVEEASIAQRVEAPISELMLGTECGGSDPTSGIAANPLVGSLSDRLVELGGTSILSETPEFIGAEHILAKRAKTPEIGQRILDIVYRYEDSLKAVGEEVRRANPTPGNKAGGITTLEEKSLGCIHKGGHTPVNAVYDYAKPVTEKGLVIMDTPGQDPSSVAAMVAGGAQIVVFTTGRGSPMGNPIAPVIKITGNRGTFATMGDNIDFDASDLIFGPKSMKTLTDDLLKLVVDTANGKVTKAESLGINEISVMRVHNFV